MTPRLIPLSDGGASQTLSAGGFILTETVRSRGQVLSRHCHEHTNIALVLRGVFLETVNERPCEIDFYSLILRPGGEPHANRYEKTDACCLIIEVQPQRLEMIREVSSVLDSAAHIRKSWVPILTSKVYREFRTSDSVSSLVIESLLLDLLSRAARYELAGDSTPSPRWLRQARSMIHEEFARPLSLSCIADSVGIHPAHLARTFRRRYRCTVGEYVRRLRLDRAATELLESDKTLAEIALDCGFYDQSHFTHAFKLHHGMTPFDFRSTRNEGSTKKRRVYQTN